MLTPAQSDDRVEDALANQPIQQTATYGGNGGGNFVTMSGAFIKSLTVYGSGTNTGDPSTYYVTGLTVVYDNGASVAIGVQQTAPISPTVIDLANDTVSRLYVAVATNSQVFGSNGNVGVGGIYVETVRGNTYSSIPGCTPVNTPTLWSLVCTPDNQPCVNMVLVGIAGLCGTDIDAVSFYFKNDRLMSHGMTEVDYGALERTAETPINVATATINNLTDQDQQMSVTFEESVSSAYTFSTTDGLTVGMSTTVQAGVPFVANGEVEISGTVSFEITLGVSKTFTNTFSYNAIVTVGANQAIQATAVAASYSISGTYSAVVAEVWAHAGAFAKRITGTISGISAYDVTVSYVGVATQ